MGEKPEEKSNKKEETSLFQKLIHNEPEIKFFTIVILNLLLGLIDKILDYTLDFTFMKGCKQERNYALQQGRSAQIYRNFGASVLVGSREFNRYPLISLLLMHEQYVEPEWVLKHDNCYVWDLDKDKVLFSIPKEDVDFFDTGKYPWTWMHMSHEAEYVLVMSLDEFHKSVRKRHQKSIIIVADKLGDPSAKVTVMHMTARSGSTLISHMMHKLPNVRSIAEVWLFWYLEQDARAMNRSTEEVLAIMKSTMRYLCRQPVDKSRKIEHVFLKLTCFEGQYLHFMPKLVPNVKMIFNTRMPTPSMKSWGRLVRSTQVPSVFQIVLEKLLGRQMVKQFVLPFPLDNKKMRQVAEDIVDKDLHLGNLYNKNYEEFYSLLYMACMQTFLEHKELYKFVLLYEDLIKEPQATVRKLLEAIDETVDHVNLALEAMKVDAHQGKAGGVGAKEKYVVPQQVWDRINSYADRLGFPIRADCTEENFREVLKLH